MKKVTFLTCVLALCTSTMFAQTLEVTTADMDPVAAGGLVYVIDHAESGSVIEFNFDGEVLDYGEGTGIAIKGKKLTFGLLASLGYRFLDERGEELPPVGESLGKIARVDGSSANKLLCETSFTIACDVNNPFYGSRGAAAVYAPQKGASPDEVDFLEKGMIHYAQVIKETRQMDISEIPGAGAAGGLGGGVLPFLNAELQSGIDIVLDMLRFRETIQGADLIFTGEGKLDKQTGMGKALGGILRYAKEEAVPVIAIGGCVEACEILNEMGFASIFSIQTAPVSLQEAMDRDFALKNIRQVVTQIMRTIQIGTHG